MRDCGRCREGESSSSRLRDCGRWREGARRSLSQPPPQQQQQPALEIQAIEDEIVYLNNSGTEEIAEEQQRTEARHRQAIEALAQDDGLSPTASIVLQARLEELHAAKLLQDDELSMLEDMEEIETETV